MMTPWPPRFALPSLRSSALPLLSLLSLLFLVWAAPSRGASAAASGAQSLLINPSVRASGMGHASSAVFWGSEPNAWSNPALLAHERGVRYERARTQLVPELAKDVYFTTKRLTAGCWGVGIQLAGKPIDGVGSSRLDYGSSEGTDADGNPTGSFSSHEEIASFTGGVSALEFAEHLWKAMGGDAPRMSRFGDVSLGWATKKTHVSLAPALVTLDNRAGEGNVTTHDSGLLFRVTPYNAIDDAGWIAGLDRLAKLRVDVGYARSTLNYDDATISYIDESQADPILRTHRTGWAVRGAAALPSSAERWLEGSHLGWLTRWFSPLVGWGKAWDRQLPLILDPGTGFHERGTIVKNSGWEVTIANVYTIRRGWVEDRESTIVGQTSGWSLGLQSADLGGFSYDQATVPQSIYLGPVTRKSFSVFVNPIGAWRALRHAGREPNHR